MPTAVVEGEPPTSVVSEKRRGGAKKPWMRQGLNYVAGLTGGFVASVAGFPLDVLRIRLLFGVAVHNFFNGFGFTFSFTILKSGLVWPVQRNIKEALESQLGGGFAGNLVSGTIGNAIPGMFLNPFNIIKVRLMESHEQKTVTEVTNHIIKHEGLGAFRRGLAATLLRDALWGMLYFPLFNGLEHRLFPRTHDHHTFYQLVACSVSAASIATLCTTVIDSFRLYQMRTVTKEAPKLTLKESFRACTRPTQMNLLAMMSGIGRVAITTALGHVSYLKVFEGEIDEEELSS